MALWSNPGLPLLLTVSALSTAMAFLLLLTYTIIHDHADEGIRVLYERIDLVLIAAEQAPLSHPIPSPVCCDPAVVLSFPRGARCVALRASSPRP